MAEENGEKSQDATPHRRQQAREEGQVAQSQDLTSAAMLLGGLIALAFTGGKLWDFCGQLVAQQLGGDAWLEGSVPQLMTTWHGVVSGLAKTLLPLLATLMLLAIALNLAQVGPLFLPDKLAPDLSRLNPLDGLARIFSMRNLVKLMFGIFKIGIVATVAFFALYNRQEEILRLATLDIAQVAWLTWDICFWTCVKMAFALLVLALLDYGYQRYRFEQDLKMTPQQVREEMRNLQGDPQIIARRRAAQRQMAMHRLSTDVPKADVIVTNPTELAIALKYDTETMAAPIVVAKGAGTVAQRIRRLALEHGVPIVEKKPLAQTLFRDVEINHPIPNQLYAAVAEVLAYVYQLQGKSAPGTKV